MSVITTEEDWICLSLLPGIGPAGIKKLIDHFGDPESVFAADNRERAEVQGLRQSQLRGFDSVVAYRKLAEDQLQAIKKNGAFVITPDTPGFPALLREIYDPPVVLYGLGNLDLLSNDCVAMVGSRSATTYGRRIARSFSQALSEYSLTVVSGLALGIDSESHAGALQGKGSTVAVLGCGLDVVYPRQNKALFQQIGQSGLILSEYPLGTKPDGFRFPARNRIIAGICKGVVVVEAARKSGSLITAQMALDFGREIFAVPGQVDSCKSEGTHWLLQQGAQLIASAEDVLAELGEFGLSSCQKKSDNDKNNLTGLDPDAVGLLKHIEPYAMSRDEIAEKANMQPSRMSELFLFLELEGQIEILPGDLVRRIVR